MLFDRDGILTISRILPIAEIRALIEARLGALGHRVPAVVNYDYFSISPELMDDYIAMVRGVVRRHYTHVTPYTSSTFLRAPLGEACAAGAVSADIFDSAEGTLAHLRARKPG